MNGLGGPLLWAQQMGPGALDGGLPPGTTGYGAALLRSIVALAVVCVAAWVSLRWAAKRGIALGGNAKGARVRVLERVALDARRTLFVVQADERVLLLGAGDGGGLTLLTELAAKEPARESASAGGESASFKGVLARLRLVDGAAGERSNEQEKSSENKPREGEGA